MGDSESREVGEAFVQLVEVVRPAALDCPWHQAQTPVSLSK